MSKKVQSTVNEANSPETTSPKTGISLKFGYQDKEETEQFHKYVGFGRRPTGKDFISAADNCNGSDLQFTLSLAQAAITEFGQMTMPVPLTVLLSLNQIDRELLNEAYFSFLADTSGDSGILNGGGKVRLGFGLERDGKKIVNVEFGKLLTGYDEIEIENANISTWEENALRIAKEIVSPSDITLDEMKSLDIDDFTLLRNAEEAWLNSFRSS